MPRTLVWMMRLSVLAALIVLTPLSALAGTTGKL